MASSSSYSQSCICDVFLSFRGEDTRKTFVDHLYSTLVDRKISTYKDDTTLPRGENIRSSLFKAIERSHIAIVIFSKHYADSSWCLEELAHILKCKDERRLIVMPIFYDVDPSEVRNQNGKFKEAFAKHEVENIAKVELWRKALVEASEIAGWEPKNIANGHEANGIKEIVDVVSNKLVSLTSCGDEDLVGMGARLQDLEAKLEIGSDGVRMVGIWGGGGSGKTTLASSLYMKICRHFQSHCIIESVREKSSKHGLETLQEKIISSLLKTKTELSSVGEGKHIIRRRLSRSNVLIILDDVDDCKQLDALAGSHSWFGNGSRIIITTRDKHLLITHKVDHVWMSTKETMEIFEACGYHPLIGINVLRQKALLTIMDGEFNMHDLVQEMAHYIVRGKHPNNPEKHSRVWKRKDIINMCFDGATMVQENDKTEAIKYFGTRPSHSSLFCKIVSNMKKLRWLYVSLDTDDENVEGPTFLSNELRYIQWENYPGSPFPESFQPMKLVALKLSRSLQKELWKGYKHLPCLKVLELDDMKNLLSTPDFDGLPSLQNLTLYECEELEEIHASLGKHKTLECVSVSKCDKLRMFPTIVQMGKLKSLEIRYCQESLEFPEIKSKMESLVKVSLSDMVIDSLLPSIGERCANLVSLDLVNCSVLKKTEAHFDGLKHLEEFRLNRLAYMKMTNRPGISTRHWHGSQLSISLRSVLSQLTYRLRKLDLSHSSLRDGEIPPDIGELFNLRELNLSWNDFTRLDFSLSQLTRLKILYLNQCELLVELPKLPLGIVTLEANFCKSLTTIDDAYKNCTWLCQVSLLNGGIQTDGNKLLQSMLQGNAIENHCMLLQLEGFEIAKAFTPLHEGGRYRLKLPKNWCNDFSGFLLCAVVTRDSYYISQRVSMTHMMSGMGSQDNVVWKQTHDNDKRTWIGYVPFSLLRQSPWWDKTYKEVLFSIQHNPISCSGFRVRLVERKSKSGSIDILATQEESEFSSYTPKFEISRYSANALEIRF
ncbi:putative TIR domain, P-loop containing nucleoside triphosphate hydrolase [Helianthus debilis subsp. tardiflorus]